MKKTALLGISTAALASTALVASAQGLIRSGNRLGGGTGAGGSLPVAAGAALPGVASEARASAAPGAGENEQASDLFIPAGTELDFVLKIYGQLVGKTVLRDPGVPDAKITLVSQPGQKLTKEDQIAAIEAALEMNGIHMEPYGEGLDDEEKKFVRALPRDKARVEAIPMVEEDAEIPNSAKVVSVMIPFKNIPIDEAKTVLEGLKSPKGLLNVYERIGKILVTDTGLNINIMRQVAKEIDVATPINENVFVRQIKNASAADIKTAIEQIVQESQKELEKASKAQQNAQQPFRPNFNMMNPAAANPPNGSLLRRPGQPNQPNQPQPAANVESLVTSVSDADRGMIRGKVLITADERSNKLIAITSKANMDFFDKLIEELDVTTTPEVEVKVVRLKYADAEDVADMIDDLIGNSSSARNNQRGNQNQNARNGTGGNLTRNTNQPQNRTPTNAAANQRGGESKAGELSKDNVTVLADKRINGLVVMAHKDVWSTVSGIIDSMDVKLSQVLIETCIIEVTLGDDLNTGIDWVSRGRERVSRQVQATDNFGRKLYVDEDGNRTTDETGNTPLMTTVTEIVRDSFANRGGSGIGGGGGSTALSGMFSAATNTVGAFGSVTPIGSGINYLLKSDKLNIAAVINATKSDSRAKYLASPIVMTVDNKEATVEATEARKFFNGYETSSSYSNYVRTPRYDSKDIGITIKVTPKINPNGTVMLKVEEEYSQLGAGQSILVDDGSTANIDTALTRKMSADVLLDNMQTVVLGGLTERFVSEKETGIPILKDIPWIGKWLFGSVTQTESRKELLVFMTPYVLDDAQAAQAEAARRKGSLSDSRPFETGGWSASPLADPVAQKEVLNRLKDEAKKRDEERANRLAIEKWKLDRAKELDKLSAAERKFWLEQHRDEIVEEADKEAFDKEVGEYSQDMLRDLAQQIRAEKVKKANEAIDQDGAALKADGEKSAEAEPANGAAAAATTEKEAE